MQRRKISIIRNDFTRASVALACVVALASSLGACGSRTAEQNRDVDVVRHENTQEGLNIQARPSGTLPAEELQSVARDIGLVLEQPFAAGAEEGLRHLTVWLAESPDVTVNVCGPPFEGFWDTEDQFSYFLSQHFMLAMARYIIEHPDQANNIAATHLAGFEAMLGVYEQAKERDPANERPGPERLLNFRASSELERRAQELEASCPVPAEEGEEGELEPGEGKNR